MKDLIDLQIAFNISGDVAKMSPPLVFSASLRTTNGSFKGFSPRETASQLA